jgi:hypothetical protein
LALLAWEAQARNPPARLRRIQVESTGTTINFRPAAITHRDSALSALLIASRLALMAAVGAFSTALTHKFAPAAPPLGGAGAGSTIKPSLVGSTYQRLKAIAPFTISNSRTTAIRTTGGPSGIKGAIARKSSGCVRACDKHSVAGSFNTKSCALRLSQPPRVGFRNEAAASVKAAKDPK